MSEYFEKMYKQAFLRDHVLAREVERVWHGMRTEDDPSPDLVACVDIAEGMMQAHEEFLDRLEPLARDRGVNLRVTPGFVCSVCNSESCPSLWGAIDPQAAVLANMQQAMMGMLKHKKG